MTQIEERLTFGTTETATIPAERATRIMVIEGIAVLVLLLWIGLVHFIEWPAPLYPSIISNSSIDAAFYAYSGELIRTGGAPYLSFWDHKPPAIHLINALALSLSDGHVWGIWLISMMTLLTAALFGYFAMRKAFGVLPALFGLAFFALSLSLILASNMTEGYVLPIQWLAVLLFVYQRSFDGSEHWLGGFLGILGTVAFLLRPNLIGAVLSTSLVIWFVLAMERRHWGWVRFIMGGFIGVAFVTLLLIGYLWQRGAVSAFIDQVFHYNSLYVTTTWHARLWAGITGIRATAFHGAIALSLAGWLIALTRLRHSWPASFTPALLLSAVWLPIEFLFSTLSGRQYGHYFMPLFVPLSFLAALCASEMRSAFAELFGGMELRSRAVIIALAAGLAFLPFAHLFFKVRDHGLYPTRMEQIAPMVQYIQTATPPDAAILVWGHASDLYFFSQRKPASRFIYPLPLLTPGYATPELIDQFLGEVRRSAPALIIDAAVNNDAKDFARKKGQDRIGAGEDLVPSLETWNPSWHYPRLATWQGSYYWTMTPSLKSFYDFVADQYEPIDRLGPQRWTVYKRKQGHGMMTGER